MATTPQLLQALRSMASDEPLALRVRGQCMEPLISDESEIVVAANRRYWPGDIVAFRSTAGDLRVHRLIGFRWRRGRFTLQTRADATGTIDEPITQEQVIGKVIGSPERLGVSMIDRAEAIARFIYLRLRGRLR